MTECGTTVGGFSTVTKRFRVAEREALGIGCYQEAAPEATLEP
jgi:hypothetical protein